MIKKTTCLLAALIVSFNIYAQQIAIGLKTEANTNLLHWNGVAAANNKRLFADFPRSAKGKNPSVIEIKNGREIPFPGGDWNEWQPGKDTKTAFVCINALYMDRKENHLWVVDAGDPFGEGHLKGAPKLVEIDLKSNKVLNNFLIDEEYAPNGSHLNDMRIVGDNVFISESRIGSILILNRKTRKIRRLLAASTLTKADSSVHPVVNGLSLQGANGKTTILNVDDIELSPDGHTFYFMSPFGPNLYRIAVADLLNEGLTDRDLEKRVTIDQKLNPVGGIIMDTKGNLYLSEVETNSIRCIGPDKKTKWVLHDDRLIWPDAYSITPDGTVYVAIAQNSNLPFMHHGQDVQKPPFYIFSFKAAD